MRIGSLTGWSILSEALYSFGSSTFVCGISLTPQSACHSELPPPSECWGFGSLPRSWRISILHRAHGTAQELRILWATTHRAMKSNTVSDGESRLRDSPEFQTLLRKLRDSIRAGYAAEFAQAGFVRRLMLRSRMAADFRAERQKIEPSSQSLYNSKIAARKV